MHKDADGFYNPVDPAEEAKNKPADEPPKAEEKTKSKCSAAARVRS
jgi:hypothetical protein